MKIKPSERNKHNLRARLLGKLPSGLKVYRWPIEITCGELASLTQENIYPEAVWHVDAPTARDAADYVAEKLGHLACVEVDVWGLKGGLACHRYWGWERAIWNGMLGERKEAKQLRLKGEVQ